MPTTTENPIELMGREGESQLFTVSSQRGEVQTVRLKPAFISLALPPTMFKSEYRGAPGGAKVFDAALNGGQLYPGVVWLFMGEDYIRFNVRTGEIEGDRNTIASQWGGGTWPSQFTIGVDAAVTSAAAPSIIWFLKGAEYIRYNLASDRVEGGPAPIAPNWPGWPAAFADGVDAAIHGLGRYAGRAWFFKGPDYIAYDYPSNMVDGHQTIQGAWPGWPEEFASGIDCAFYGAGTESETIYFLKGDQFVTYNLDVDRVTSEPRPIISEWPKLAPYFRRPQLFLVESYHLTTYYGDITPGPLQSSQVLQGGAEETYTVIIKRSSSQTISDTMTVLESQDQTLVDNVNESMQDESAEGRQTESYDYQFDSSFEGELSYTGLGGDVNAQLSFQGGSNDVRQSASKASKNAVQKQIGKTEQNRRQMVRVVSGTYNTTDQFESTFTRKVHNPTGRSITWGMFQLMQEYITLVVLDSIRLAFANGERPDMAQLSGMDGMLEKYIANPADRQRIKQAIVKELQEARDFQGTPHSVLKQLSPERYQFDSDLKSTLVLNNPDGTPRRQIVVPGIIISHHNFKQLTDAVALGEMHVV